MIPENREFRKKKMKVVAFVSFVGLGGGGSIQTAEMNWKMLRDSFTESVSLLLSAEVNAMICVAKLHSLM